MIVQEYLMSCFTWWPEVHNYVTVSTSLSFLADQLALEAPSRGPIAQALSQSNPYSPSPKPPPT